MIYSSLPGKIVIYLIHFLAPRSAESENEPALPIAKEKLELLPMEDFCKVAAWIRIPQRICGWSLDFANFVLFKRVVNLRM